MRPEAHRTFCPHAPSMPQNGASRHRRPSPAIHPQHAQAAADKDHADARKDNREQAPAAICPISGAGRCRTGHGDDADQPRQDAPDSPAMRRARARHEAALSWMATLTGNALVQELPPSRPLLSCRRLQARERFSLQGGDNHGSPYWGTRGQRIRGGSRLSAVRPRLSRDWDGDPTWAVSGLRIRALTKHEEDGDRRTGKAGAHADFILAVRRQDPVVIHIEPVRARSGSWSRPSAPTPAD